jgi:hypothetical protein
MVAEAVASGIQARHLLFDSWFAYPATMRNLLAKGMHTLCMLKVTEKIFYRYQGKDLHLAAIYRKIRKRRGRAKILASVMVEIGKNDKGIPVPAKIVFVRDRRTKKWLALLSNDIALGNEEIVTALYGPDLGAGDRGSFPIPFSAPGNQLLWFMQRPAGIGRQGTTRPHLQKAQ